MGDPKTAEAIGDVLVLRPAAAHLKLEAAQAIAETLASPVYHAVRKIVVVLSRVEYIDSTAISLLVRIATERQLRLCALSPKIRKVLENLRLVGLFEAHDTEAQALAAFGKPGAAK